MNHFLNKNISVAPLVVFRILFGALLMYACFWSLFKDDIANRYFQAQFFFKYYGFEWISYPGEQGIYALYLCWLLGAAGILFGAFYRCSILLFLGSFSYLQLIDASNYINHYYALILFSFCLFWLPAQSLCSIDVCRNPKIRAKNTAVIYLFILRGQVAVIYFFAAVAKFNTDWLLTAMPLKIWLLQLQDFPIIGTIFKYHSVHLFASWAAFVFDLTIVGLLLFPKTRKIAYIAVVFFHGLTGLLFNIGLFPLLMITCTTLFFSPSFFDRCLSRFSSVTEVVQNSIHKKYSPSKAIKYLFIIYFMLQIIMPLRHVFLYDDFILWTENGYRFSWRVMLVEKEGRAIFRVKDRQSQQSWEVSNSDFLTAFQEKRMAVRPFHIVQFGQYVGKEYAKKFKIKEVQVFVDVAVTLNGRVSQVLIDPTFDLMNQEINYNDSKFILPLGNL